MQLIKLNQASENLILTSTPINLVSEQLGYLDDTSFRRSFKSVTGYTPSEYRQNIDALIRKDNLLVGASEANDQARQNCYFRNSAS